MLALYIVATLLGGTLLLSSLFFGHHAGHELDHAHETGSAGGAFAAYALSLRFWTYLVGFGGATGLLLHLLAHTPEPLAAGLSLSIGAISGVGAQLIMRRMGQDSGGTVAQRELLFRLGTMLLPASPGVKSRVRLTINNQSIDMTAITDDAALSARDEVLVLEIKDGVATVTRNQPAGEKP